MSEAAIVAPILTSLVGLMAIEDRFGLKLTTTSPKAAQDYVAAVDLMLSANHGAEALLDRALAADPDFALAHVGLSNYYGTTDTIPPAEAMSMSAATRSPAKRSSRS